VDGKPSPRLPGSFHALGSRLLREAFPAIGSEAVESYLRRAKERIPRGAATRPMSSSPKTVDSSINAVPMVLIIDDEEDLRDIMRRMLERRGFHTLLASDVHEALQVLHDHPSVVDFVVTDLGLPGVTDHDFASTLTASQPDVRIVFISGLPREMAILDHLITADAVLVKKPFSAEALIEALREASRSSAKWAP
jgi:CheY-like chemotaxis protein